MRKLLAVLLLTVPALAATPPAIFFTDLTSAPNTGGENSAGAYVTIYGNNFGTSPTVTWNSLSCVNVITVGGNQVNTWLWYQKIVVQLTSSCTAGTGNFVVAAGGQNSNGYSFTARSSGNIYCVSTSGNNSNNGHFPSSCWATILNAKNTIAAGDIAYVENGVAQTTEDNYSAALVFSGAGTAANPKALVVYPGASATIGSTSLDTAVRATSINGAVNYWVIAGFYMPASNTSINLSDGSYSGSDHFWFIADESSCPNGNGSTACVTGNFMLWTWMYGDYVHDAGVAPSAIKTYHAVYFSSNYDHVWIGWNHIGPNTHACRGVQFFSTGGSDQYDLHVHDNVIHDMLCDGINFATVVPSTAIVEAYNNLIYHAGMGAPSDDGAPPHDCIRAAATGASPLLIYNNTMYDCGPYTADGSQSGIQTQGATQLNNNILWILSGAPYFNATGACTSVTGSNNLWFGSGSPPCSGTLGTLNVNPQLSSPSDSPNYQTSFVPSSQSSPVVGAGTATLTATYDILGLIRPNPPSIGAYEFTSGAGAVMDAGAQGPVAMQGAATVQ